MGRQRNILALSARRMQRINVLTHLQYDRCLILDIWWRPIISIRPFRRGHTQQHKHVKQHSSREQ